MIEPHFQIRLIARLAAWVAFATVITGVVTWGVLNYEDRTQPGSYFYVQPEGGSAPVILKRSGLILPAVALSGGVVVIGSLFLPGRSRRIRQTLESSPCRPPATLA